MRLTLVTIFFSVFLQLPATAQLDSNHELPADSIDIFWHPLSGLITSEQQKFEYHVVNSFKKYINQKYNQKIRFRWIRTDSYENVLRAVENDSMGAFGAANFSITDERKKRVDFLSPHFPDIMVLVSNVNIPIAQTSKEFEENASYLKNAITIQGTTFEKSIKQLEDTLNTSFNFKFVNNGAEMVESISNDPTGFGYVPLTILLSSINNKSQIRRQFFYTVKLEGLAMIQTKNSKWSQLTDDYFNSEQFLNDRDSLISKFYGKAAFETIKSMSKSVEIGPYEEIIIANREREIQYRQLLKAAENERKGYVVISILILVAVITIFTLIYITFKARLQSQTTKSLREKQRIIETQNTKLQDLDKRKNELIRVLAHDLRTPVFQIKSIMEVLNLDNISTDKRAELFTHLDLSCDRISELITRILNTEAVEEGRFNLKLETLDLNAIIENLVNQLGLLAEKREVLLTMNLEPNLKIKADSVFLTQILNNLLDNGMIFGGKNSEVSIQAKTIGEHVQIIIKDQGPGIASQKALRIFESTHANIENGNDTIEELSYGLFLIKKHTELMNGTFSFISNAGNGTTFFIQLPKA